MIKHHLRHKTLSCFTQCGILSTNKTTDIVNTTCLNCLRTHWFYQSLIKRSRNKKNRFPLSKYEFVNAVGIPVALNGNNLLIRNLIINNQFMLDHIWLHGADVDPSKIIIFRAKTYSYRNKKNKRTYSLDALEILKTY